MPCIILCVAGGVAVYDAVVCVAGVLQSGAVCVLLVLQGVLQGVLQDVLQWVQNSVLQGALQRVLRDELQRVQHSVLQGVWQGVVQGGAVCV